MCPGTHVNEFWTRNWESKRLQQKWCLACSRTVKSSHEWMPVVNWKNSWELLQTFFQRSLQVMIAGAIWLRPKIKAVMKSDEAVTVTTVEKKTHSASFFQTSYKWTKRREAPLPKYCEPFSYPSSYNDSSWHTDIWRLPQLK